MLFVQRLSSAGRKRTKYLRAERIGEERINMAQETPQRRREKTGKIEEVWLRVWQAILTRQKIKHRVVVPAYFLEAHDKVKRLARRQLRSGQKVYHRLV